MKNTVIGIGMLALLVSVVAAQDVSDILEGFYTPKGLMSIPTFEIVVGDDSQDIEAATIVLSGLASYVEQHGIMVTEIGRIESARVTEITPEKNYIFIGTPKSNHFIEQELALGSSLVLGTSQVKKIKTKEGQLHIIISGEKHDDILVAAGIFKEWVSQQPALPAKQKIGFFQLLRNWFSTL